jgi:hypothetical protein
MRLVQFTLFTAGYASICYGCYRLDPAIGFITAGSIVCGLMVWHRVHTNSNQNGKQPGGDPHA